MGTAPVWDATPNDGKQGKMGTVPVWDATPNDGKQTPMRGHPVFKAQHACACCCRDCLAKWGKVPRGVETPAERQQGIVDFLMAWIEREMGR